MMDDNNLAEEPTHNEVVLMVTTKGVVLPSPEQSKAEMVTAEDRKFAFETLHDLFDNGK